jgi:putative mRNA 3-end processing factor
MRAADLLHLRPEGLYCAEGDFYIDPVRPVSRAVITHGHADHARAGHAAVLATPQTLAIMAVRYGANFTGATQALDYGQAVTLGGVGVRLIPAGHVLGSAQVVVEKAGARVIATGDYKRRSDPTCTPFEPMACDIFISEATFALPVFRHPDDRGEIARLLSSVETFQDRTHLVGAYGLGKAQRVIALLRAAGYHQPIYLHGAVEKLCAMYEAFGVRLGDVRPAHVKDSGRTKDFAGAIVIAPPSAFSTPWARRFSDPLDCFASGWMQIRQRARQRGVELPLVISDHADWDELTTTILEVTPQELWVTHGRDDALTRWAQLQGLSARALALSGREEEAE